MLERHRGWTVQNVHMGEEGGLTRRRMQGWVDGRIEMRARRLYEQRLRPKDKDLDIWLDAERQVVIALWQTARKIVRRRRRRRQLRGRIVLFLLNTLCWTFSGLLRA